MTKFKTAMMKGCREGGLYINLRRVVAMGMILSLMLPVTLPIPAYAYSMALPKVVNQPFALTGSDSSLSTWASELVSKMMAGPAALFAPSSRSEETKEALPNPKELGKRVAGISTEVQSGNEYKVGQIISLAAVPVDKKGGTVHGIAAKWHCADPKIVRILNDSEAVAVGEGETKLSVHTGGVLKELAVRVTKRVGSEATSVLPDDELPVLSEQEAQNLVTPENNLGSPVGQNEMGSRSSASAIRTRERYGSSNYSFGIPAASLPGRGMDASVGITYNSRVWNMSNFSGTRTFTFNTDNNWLAPGFEMGFGDITSIGSGSVSGYMLSSPDGTRHQLLYKQASGGCSIYESTDGTFIQTTICGIYTTSTMNVVFPDGSQVMYGGTTSSGKRFPVRITDRNGNKLTIAYVQNDYQGKILYVRDTLSRYINFHYETGTSDKKLVAITVPGYDGSTTERQTIRFYYEDLTLQTAGRFEEPVQIIAPTTPIKVLRFVYFPGTQTGFRYDYSPYYGIIYKIWQLRGMEVTGGTSLTETGTVNGNHNVDPSNWAAWTYYNYKHQATNPEPPQYEPPLTDVPKYTLRKDDWQGRTTNTPQTNFQSFEEVTPSGCQINQGTCTGTRTVTVSAPDGTRSISVSKIRPAADWENGLLAETRIETGATGQEIVWSKTKLFWEQGADSGMPGRDNPRLDKIEVTNDANQTRATSFDYDNYNNATHVREHDFAASGTLGTELRRTETTYETGAGWINNRLLRLPKIIQTIVNSQAVSKVVFEYDNNGANLTSSNITYREDISTSVHDVRYNPSAPSGQQCAPQCEEPARCCWEVPVYQSYTRFRGNVTKIIAFPDTSKPDNDPGNTVSTIKYDITGNVVESSSSCCELKTRSYVVGNHYAYPASETRSGQGLQLTTGATYDFNTGVIKTGTDENGQTTSVTYNADNLRVTQVDGADGSRTSTEYNDATFPYHVKSTVKLDATRSVSSWSFSNGRGQNFQNRSQTSDGYLSSDVEFDLMARAVKSYNPYTVSTLTAAQPSGVKFAEVTLRDGLGRTLQTKLPDDTTINATYQGLVATVTDQAGKSRRQLADTLGRIIRVDEPNSSGILGDVASPNQPTYYEYDGNDNLTKVTQTDTSVTPNVTQERLFKYDSLSRLTHERQVEASSTLDNDGVKGTASPTKWTGVYKYNTDNLVVEGFDARGVKTAFTYDGLNRIKTVAYTGESGYLTPNVTYTYDETETGFYNSGRLTKVETALNTGQGTPATVHNFRYDKVGQVKKQTTSIGSESYLQEYGYNLAGQLTSQKYPSGKIVNMTVDDFGRLSTVSETGKTYLSSVSFNDKGLLSQLNLGNGTHETFSYNDRFQMTSQSLMKSSTVQQKYDYSYGTVDLGNGDVNTTQNNGQLGKVEGFIGSNKQWSQRFGYDELGRLKEAREYRGDNSSLTYKQVFDFDRFGNLYRKAASNPTTGQEDPLPYTPIETSDIDRATNRLATETTYDEAGQVTTDNKFRDMGFAYDANGRMVKATKTSVPDAWTVYDALGNRVAAKVNDVWRFMIYDAFGKLVAEYGQADEGIGGVSYIQQDWQGSVRTVSNSNGFVVSRTDHQAFGEAIGAGIGLRLTTQGYYGTTATRQGYGLTETDEATGTAHTGWRKLETAGGRWTGADPYKRSMSTANPQSFNRYSYVVNQPTNFVDPSGLEWVWLCAQYARFWVNEDGSIGDEIPNTRHWHCEWYWVMSEPIAVVNIDPNENPGAGILVPSTGPGRISTIINARSPRDIFLQDCLKAKVANRLSHLDRQRANDLDLSFVGAMALSPGTLYPPLGGLLPGSVYGPDVRNNKNELAKLAVVGILINPFGTALNIFGAAAREGTYGAISYRQRQQAAREPTQEDRDECSREASRQGL